MEKKSNVRLTILAQTENFSVHSLFYYEFFNFAQIYDAPNIYIYYNYP